jgi:hypothetical protein
MRAPFPILLSLLFLLCGGRLHATPVAYRIDFAVDTCYSTSAPAFTPGGFEAFSFMPARGDLFHAQIAFDDAALAADGTHTGVGLGGFRLEIAGLTWDPSDAASSFRGFRGPGLGAISPVLISSGGMLTGLQGGVYGGADYPFVDFLADGGWAAVDPRLNVIRGSLSVESPAPAVPDMPSGWGLALGLGAMAAAARVRRT